MQPYVIRQGDYMAKLADKFGFDADKVWNDPQNAQLRQDGKLSQDPNILNPTDTLYIPDQDAPPATHSLEAGTTNSFESDAPPVNVNLKFVDAEFASQAFTVTELPTLDNLTTGADGTVTFAVPATQETFTVVFTSDGRTFTCCVGHIDPISTVSGVAQRLQNLGYLDSNVDFGVEDVDAIREALREFRASQSADDSSSPPSSGDSSDDDPDSPASGGLSDDDSDSFPPISDATAALLKAAHGL